MAGGGLAWTWMGEGGARQHFHPKGDYKLPKMFGRDFYLTSLLYSVLDGLKMLARAIYLSILFTPAIAMPLFAHYFGPKYREKWIHFVYIALEKAGPAFIKWGQWAATRRDLFLTDLCIELSKLQTIKAPEHSFDYTKETVEKAFGRNLLDIFVDFEEAPVGSGQLTQVHRATLRCDNPDEEKIRHPSVKESLERDLSIVCFFSKLLSLIIPTTTYKWSRFDETLEEFAVFMGSQVDLTRKAVLLSCFNHILTAAGVSKWWYLACPEPLHPLVHPEVLVENFEEGESIARIIQGDGNLNPSRRVGFVNADMSPRNILVSSDRGKPHFIILDVGMATNISKTDKYNVVRILRAVGRRDGRTAAEQILKFSKKQECPCPDAFIEDVSESFTLWDTTGALARPTKFLQRLLEKARDYDVNISGSACSVLRHYLDLEGWQQIVCLQSVKRTIPTLQFLYPTESGLPLVSEYRNERGERSFRGTDKGLFY
ncbi:hypothetical protein IFM89_023134 [Coptis chinensis]|uniref:ABC1 atypical kinase-like domain-containing protein n=1 Tax=Coptis chinensis TaxID=261450 RepID=A0A835HWR8_9MAGN|nr:hypothetical protein IFM89_023134 [Coptis chinensis]